MKHLEIMQEWANKIKVPSDIGRIPNKIATGDGFSGFTADQWKTFIFIYATTITWDLLNIGKFFRAQICAVHRTPKSAQVCEPAAESQRKIIIKSVQIFKYKNSVKICKINLRRFSKVKFMLRCILTEKLYYLLPVVFIVQLYHSIILLILKF